MSKLSDRFKDSEIISEEIEQIEQTELDKDTELVDKLLEKVNSVPYWNEYTVEKQNEMVKSFVENLQVDDKEAVYSKLVQYVTGFGMLQNLLDNENVNAVYVNDVKSVLVEIDGRVFNTEMKLTENMLSYVLNITGNRAECVYSCRIDDYMIDVIKPDVCKNGVNIMIRKIKIFNAEMLVASGMMTKEIFNFLAQQISNGKRIVISGGVNSGKTTLLDALIKYCLCDKRCYLFEQSDLISAKSDLLVKLDVAEGNYSSLLSVVQKANPEYIISDLNSFDDIASVSTLRSLSLENTFRTLVSKYGDMSEKYAKLKVLNDFDYIVHLEGFKIASVAELKPAKTMALSVNVIYEL